MDKKRYLDKITRKKDKRGQTTMFIFVGLVIVLGYILFLIVLGTFAVHVNSALSQDVDIGQVNLKTVNSESFGMFNKMVVDHADFWGLSIIFGMILGLFLTAYMTRNSVSKIGILFDIFIIIAVFIVSLYLSATYSKIVNALSSAGETFTTVNLEHTSFFMLHLPIFVVIIGVVMMILFHAGIPKKTEEANTITDIVS